jgi:hypothetical protein
MADVPTQVILAAFKDEDGAEVALAQFKEAQKEHLINAVAQMQLTFLTDFRFHGGPLRSGPRALDKYFPEPASAGPIPTTFVTNVPGDDHRAVTDAIWDLIEHADSAGHHRSLRCRFRHT